MNNVINEFKGKYYFLSNFYNAPVKYKGLKYLNNEAAFHAQKDLSRAEEFVNLPPNLAKRLGRKVNLRKDWEDVKVDIMYEINVAKFTQNEDLKEMLLKTGSAKLIEGNTWHDTFWGVCNGEGRNELGKILERVRSELR
jgi:ribA/ribD-fused uncharacterized protein